MNKILKDIPNVFVYLDVVLIYFPNYEKHVELVETDLKRLYESVVSIKFEKNNFALDSVKYLGYIITHNGIKPDISKIEEFNVNEIRTKKKLVRLLVFFN
ncbi:Retrovirus-related Pol polyprotein from transposon gypsy [Dictyocoela muelleri]|nr:Retrovirus-related Pol polyprotein from transposon gypsy [Dictyocoela muelleri]